MEIYFGLHSFTLQIKLIAHTNGPGSYVFLVRRLLNAARVSFLTFSFRFNVVVPIIFTVTDFCVIATHPIPTLPKVSKVVLEVRLCMC